MNNLERETPQGRIDGEQTGAEEDLSRVPAARGAEPQARRYTLTRSFLINSFTVLDVHRRPPVASQPGGGGAAHHVVVYVATASATDSLTWLSGRF
ncbi:hypothetical protein EVAR_82924_1 [Eumeta japonica]|uniref:Uncharacterized protein n=1 Tax=Eumeta variegata TaxID=151549 RepID=A0A4C1X2L3_EUMVA|nr:hypothetical protein EVAR_82924_1 [Eumeta japonica]